MSKKGCFNEKCVVYRKQIKYKDTYNYCPICAIELAYVCGDSKCYKPLRNVLKKYCDSCLASKTDRNEKRKAQMAGLAKNTGVIVGVVGTAIATIAGAKDNLEKIVQKK